MADIPVNWLPGSERWTRPSRIHGEVSSQARWLGCLLMGASLASLLTMLPMGLACVSAILCAIVLVLAGRKQPSRLIKLSVGIPASLAVAVASFSGYASSAQEMVVAYAMLLLAMKTMEVRAIRDLRVVAILSLLPSLISLVGGAKPITIAIATLVVPCSLGMLMFVCDTEAGQVVERGASWRYPLRGLAKLAWALPLSLLMFFLLPRLDSPLWGHHRNSATTGMSDTMSPGQISELLNNPDLAFTVLFDKPLPLGLQPYWRGVVMTHYDGAQWSVERGGDDGKGNAEGTGTTIGYTMSLEPQNQSYIPALDLPVLDKQQRQAAMNTDMTVASLSRWDRSRTLRMTAVIDGHNTAALGKKERERNLALPHGFNPRAVSMARRWRREAGSESQYIKRVAAYFQTQLTYTLTPPLLGRDGVDEMLFETHQGFCEHFASAFAVLMRAGGIPTRVVTGYQGGSLNSSRDFYVVQQLYAHAWTEIWREGTGWERVDPTTFVTTQRPLSQETENPILRAVGAKGLGRWLQHAWKSAIGDFDANSQRYITQRLMMLRNPSGGDLLPEWMGRGLLSVGGMIVALLLLLLARNILRKPRRAAGDRLETAWQRACARLVSKAGLPKMPHLTAHQAIDLARKHLLPDKARQFEQLAQRYIQSQYAANPAPRRRILAIALMRWRPGRIQA